jgi:hypothetical protein
MRRARSLWRAWPALLALAAAGCGAPEMIGTHIGGDLAPGDFNYPARNPQPARTIVIAGQVAPKLELELVAHYLTDGSAMCSSTSSFIAGAVEGARRPSAVSVPLQVSRQGDSYSATVTVDAFVPGRCDWRFGYVTARVSKGGVSSFPNIILRARDGLGGPSVEAATHNSADTPVVWHCRLGGPVSACGNWPRTGQEKIEQRYSPATARMTANFLDDATP